MALKEEKKKKPQPPSFHTQTTQIKHIFINNERGERRFQGSRGRFEGAQR